jgi:two-component system, NtrC family, nitrogen regulation response regulator GlnG
MDDKDESTEKNYLIPSAAHTLAQRSDALLIRGIRDLEAVEQKERIFVVDDQESLREVICSMLTSAGYECRAFAGGLEAIASLESGEKCDLLLTDLLNLPLDGFSLLERVKQKFPKVEVIIASAIHDDAVTEACIRSGAYQYLREPFEREQLLDAVSGALEHRRVKLEHHE